MDSVNSTDSTPTTTSAARQADRGVAHVVPLWVLLAVWAGLLVLTYLTVTATYVDFGKLNLWIAMIIATVKASLVALYFMHLRYDHPFYGLILIAALLFIVLFIGLVLVDTAALLPSEIAETGSA